MTDVRKILEPLLADRDQLLEEETAAKEKVANLRAEIVRLERILRAGGMLESPERETRPTPRQSKTPDPKLLKAVREYLTTNGSDFTRNSLLTTVRGVGPNAAADIVDYLRSTGEIRLIGAGRGGGRVYAVTDRLEKVNG